MRWRDGAMALGAFVAMTVGSTAPAEAQDIELRAARRGVELPAAYYQRIQADPDAYTLPNGLFRITESGARAPDPVTGSASVPVILALFADSEDPYPTFSETEIARVLFDGPARYGTITEAYDEISRGAFTVEGVVLPWVRTSLTMVEAVGTQNGFGQDADLGAYFTEALDLVDPDVDFGQFDNDGADGIPNSGDDDGIVDALVFEFLEISGSCGGPSIWPHRWGMSAQTGAFYLTDDASGIAGQDVVYIDGYITQGVSDCTGTELQSANVIAHEYGHVLGLPDYYHWIDRDLGPRGRRWVIGCWALMAAGSWGCGPVEEEGELREPFGPSHMMAWSKYQLGWADLVDPGEVWNEEIVLEPIQSSGTGLRIPLDDAGNEFLIAEYRTQEGFDEGLPASGVLFYKQDVLAPRRPDPESDDPYELYLLEQDGNDGLQLMAVEGGNRGEAGDAWGLSPLMQKLNYHSTPELRLSDGGYGSAMVHEVVVDGGVARIVMSTGATPRLVQPTEPFEVMRVRTFRAGVRIAGGRGPYTGVGDVPAGMGFEAFGDELLLVGSVRDEGPFSFTFAVRDARGAESDAVTIDLSAPIPWDVDPAALIDVFLDPTGEHLTQGELEFLDEIGNANGSYDVGDLRKWRRENP